MTPFDKDDMYNLVEQATVRTLCADDWLRPNRYLLDGFSGDAITLQGAGNVELIHTKLHRSDEDFPRYTERETPAVGIWCDGQTEDAGALGEAKITLSAVVDAVVYDGDSARADRRTKVIVARVRSALRKQMFTGGSELDGFAHGGDVALGDQVAFDMFEGEYGGVAVGATRFDVVIFSGVR